MKVTSDSNPQPNPATTIDKESARSDIDGLAGDDAEGGGFSEKTSFASVLDRVTQARQEPQAGHTERRSAEPLPTRESKARQKDERVDTATIGVADPSLRPEPLANAESNTDIRAVLHTVDLERIVAACRVQVAADGQREVTFDLSHSVLSGLRIKVSADSAGRVATEFLAANDGIKSLLDARSSDLIALLRSRGVNLVNFKTSVATDANSGGGSRSGQETERRLEGVSQHGAALSVNGLNADGAADDELAIGATYRA